MGDIIHIILLAVILLVSIGLHEYAHARVSYRLGDPTPKLQNRLTPNPLHHVDPIGFLLIFLIGFGRGKPVQVNPYYYKKPLQGELLVALAGPATNLVLAFLGICVTLFYGRIMGADLGTVLMGGDLVIDFWQMFSYLNIALAVFNMIPLPPLDGFRLVKIFLPSVAQFLQQYSQFVFIFLLLLIFAGRGIIGTYISTVSQFIFQLFLAIVSHVFY